MIKYLVFTIILFLPFCVQAQEYALYYTVNDSLKIGIMGAPYGSYSSEFGISFGLSAHIFEKNLSQNIYAGQDFWMRIDGEYSLINEKGLTFEGRLPFRKIKQLLSYELTYKSLPRTYHGIGGNTDKKNEYHYTKEYYRFAGNWTRAITGSAHLGMAWDLSSYQNTDLDSLISYPKIEGFDNPYKAISIGPVFIYNTKTPNNFPSSGSYYKNEILFYNKALSSDYDFVTWKQEFQYFYRLFEAGRINASPTENRPKQDHILATQIISQNTFGEVPFHYLPEQGGASLMRGLSTGRHIDKQYLAAQTEYRSPFIFWRVSAVSFLATGISYKDLNDIKIHNLNFTGGFGLRFALDKQERVNARADIGFSKDGMQIYLKFGESF